MGLVGRKPEARAGEASVAGFGRVVPYTTAKTAIIANTSPMTHRRPEACLVRDAGVALMVFLDLWLLLMENYNTRKQRK